MRIVLIMLIGFPVFCWGQEKGKSTVVINGFNGAVKKVISKFYHPQNSSGIVYGGMSISEYDKTGHTLKELFFNFNDSLTHSFIYNYNSEGRISSETGGNGDTALAITYKLIPEGGWEETDKWTDGPLSIFYYNEKGLRTKLLGYDIKGKFSDTKLYEYDKHGKILIEATTYANDNPEEKQIFKYDTLGNNVLKQRYKNGNLISETICEFDKKGNKVSEKEYVEGKLISERKITFDTQRNVLEEIYYDAVRNKISMKRNYWYSYDRQANWIKRSYSINGQLIGSTDREIIYW